MRKLLAWYLAVWLSILPAVAQQQSQPTAMPPAAMTEIAQKGVSLKPDVITPSRGLYSNTTDLLRDKDSAKILNNLQQLQRGIWTSRGIGYAKERAGVFNSGATFLEFAQHTTTAGVNRLVFQVGAKVYSYDTSTHTETEIKNSLSTSAIPCIRSFNPSNMLYTNGDINPLKWDGNPASTMSNLTGWPVTIGSTSYSKPRYCEVFANRAVFAGFDSNPFTVVLSNQNDPTNYTIAGVATDAGAFDVPSQLGKITGMRALRLSNDNNDQVLIIGCERGMALVTGYSGTTFAMKDLTREYGLASNRSWIQLQNDLLFWSTDGLRRFSQLVTNANLINASLTFNLQDLVNRIPSSKFDKIFAVHHPATQEVQFWLPVDSDTNPSHAVILNYNTRDPSSDSYEQLNPIFSTKDGLTITAGLEYAGTMYCGTSDGYLQTHYNGDTYDGTTISWDFMTPLISSNSPTQSASLRKFVIITDGPAQQFQATAYTVDTLANGASEYKQRDSRSLSVASSSITKVGTWASGTTTSYPHLIDFTSKGNGRYWALRLSGSNSGDHISLVGVQSILTVGGWKQ